MQPPSRSMRILVSDSSILIELSKHGLLLKMFDLDFEFAVPDLLFREELIDLHGVVKEDLPDLGLQIESLDSVGVALAQDYQAKRLALSLVDSFALALAKSRGWRLLTEDGTMRGLAASEGIRQSGVLWVIDHMLTANILSVPQVVEALEAMSRDPRCPVPERELARRIAQV